MRLSHLCGKMPEMRSRMDDNLAPQAMHSSDHAVKLVAARVLAIARKEKLLPREETFLAQLALVVEVRSKQIGSSFCYVHSACFFPAQPDQRVAAFMQHSLEGIPLLGNALQGELEGSLGV